MKTTFSRSLTTVAVMLLIALLLIGVSFQMLAKQVDSVNHLPLIDSL